MAQVVRLNGHGGPVYGLAPGRQSHTIFSCGSDRTVAEWDLHTLKPLHFTIRLDHAAYSLLHLPERQLLFIGNGTGGIHVVHLGEMQELKLLQNHSRPVFGLERVGNQVAAVGADGLLSVTDLSTLACIKVIGLSSAKLRAVAHSAQRNEVAVACGDGRVVLLNASDFSLMGELGPHRSSVNTVAFHPNGQHLLCGEKDAWLTLWNLETGEKVTELPAHNYAIYQVAFSPNAKLFATASRDRTVKIWDTATLTVLKRLDQRRMGGHLNSVNRLLWIDDHRLVTTGDDRSLIVWEVGNPTAPKAIAETRS